MGQLALSGTISLNDLHTEVGGTSGTECSLNDTDIKQLAYKSSSADSSLADYYGTFWHKDTITINCSLCSYTLTAFPGSQYQFNYLKTFQGWSDAPPITESRTIVAGSGPVAFGSLVDNSDYGHSIRLNGGTTVYISGIFTESGYVSQFGGLQQFKILEKYSKSVPNHASPPATYRDHGSSFMYFGGASGSPTAATASGSYHVALDNCTAGTAPGNPTYGNTGRVTASAAASSSSPQGSYATRVTDAYLAMWVFPEYGSSPSAYSPQGYETYTHLVLYPSTSPAGDWSNTGSNNTYVGAMPHTGTVTLTFT